MFLTKVFTNDAETLRIKADAQSSRQELAKLEFSDWVSTWIHSTCSSFVFHDPSIWVCKASRWFFKTESLFSYNIPLLMDSESSHFNSKSYLECRALLHKLCQHNIQCCVPYLGAWTFPYTGTEKADKLTGKFFEISWPRTWWNIGWLVCSWKFLPVRMRFRLKLKDLRWICSNQPRKQESGTYKFVLVAL